MWMCVPAGCVEPISTPQHGAAADKAEADRLAKEEADKAFARMQIKACTKWANSHLKSKGIQMDDITKELSSGLNLCDLLSLMTGEQVTPPNGPKEVELET